MPSTQFAICELGLTCLQGHLPIFGGSPLASHWNPLFRPSVPREWFDRPNSASPNPPAPHPYISLCSSLSPSTSSCLLLAYNGFTFSHHFLNVAGVKYVSNSYSSSSLKDYQIIRFTNQYSFPDWIHLDLWKSKHSVQHGWPWRWNVCNQ